MNAQQTEMLFHDTVPLEPDKLPKARERAQSQKETILRLFQKYPDRWFTPYQMRELYVEETGKPILITSVRRSMTDLTKELRLVKGGTSEQVDEREGSANNRWKYGMTTTEGLMPFMQRTANDLPEQSDMEIQDFNNLLNDVI